MSLRVLGERLLGLRGAWAALAPCTRREVSAELAKAERAATHSLFSIAKRSGGATAEDLSALGSALDVLADGLCNAAFDCPVKTLFGRLPIGLEENRHGLLALLDLLATEAFEEPETLAARLGAVDALLTVLCTEGDPAGRIAPADPVTLSPSLTALCKRARAECGDLADLEAEFFNAANLAADVADEGAMRELGARKAKLGRHYFVPGMLRAIVTYNMALLQSLPPEAWGSDWPEEEAAPAATAVSAFESVFSSALLGELLAALQRRLDRVAAAPDTFQRIAAVLDVDDLAPAVRAALRGASLDPSDLQGAIVLVGLLCQKREVVAIELQELGIDPDRMTQQWVDELDECVQREVNQSIAAGSDPDAYQRACQLSDLRNRFLRPSAGRPRRPARAQPASAEPDERQLRRQARSLASEAIAEGPAPRPDRARPSRRGALSRQRVALFAALAVAVGAALFAALAPADLFDPDIDRWAGRELAEVSEHLVAGRRDGAGAGPAFVGTLGGSWDALPRSERQREATQLLARLREAGISRAMLYGPAGRLRVQALGDSILLD